MTFSLSSKAYLKDEQFLSKAGFLCPNICNAVGIISLSFSPHLNCLLELLFISLLDSTSFPKLRRRNIFQTWERNSTYLQKYIWETIHIHYILLFMFNFIFFLVIFFIKYLPTSLCKAFNFRREEN